MCARDHSPTIVITGCGWVLADRTGDSRASEPLIEANRRLHAQRSAGVSVDDRLLDAHPDMTAELRRDRSAWVTAIAIDRALAQSRLSREALSPERTGLIVGSVLAGQLGMIGFADEVRRQSPRFVSPINFPQTVGNYLAGAIARAYNLKGPNVTLAGGPATGLDALIEGGTQLRAHGADVILTGITEVYTDTLAAAFGTLPASWIEGACWFVLERRGERPDAPCGPVIDSWSQHETKPVLDEADASPLTAPFAVAEWMSRLITETTNGMAHANADIPAPPPARKPAAHDKNNHDPPHTLTVCSGALPHHITRITLSRG